MSFNRYKPLRLIELFAGIGSQAKALKNLGVEFQHWYVCEWDKYAIQSYNAVHGTNFVTSDITELTAKDLNIVDIDHFNYLLTYSFPCQDLSNAGKGRGMQKGSGTRSGLLWEVERLLNECTELPQVLLMENVPQVHGKKNINDFNKWIEFLESKGYTNYWQDLNAKDYGIPQSRNRCFMVSMLGDCTYEFPEPIKLELTLKDVLEQEVDEKYYLSGKPSMETNSSELVQQVCESSIEKKLVKPYDTIDYSYSNARIDEINENKLKKLSSDNEISPTITTKVANFGVCVPTTSELKSKLCKELLEKGLVEEGDVVRHSYTNNRLNNGIENMGRTECKEKLCPTLDTRCDCLGVVVKEPSELQKEVCNKAMEKELMTPYDIIDYTYSNARLSEIMKGMIKTKNSTNNQIANTITTNAHQFGVCVPELRIRKLTPKECWRLMGFDDGDVEKASKVCSNAQLYKQADNSIVVNVLMAIFKNLFVPKKTRSEWLDELLGGV